MGGSGGRADPGGEERGAGGLGGWGGGGPCDGIGIAWNRDK